MSNYDPESDIRKLESEIIEHEEIIASKRNEIKILRELNKFRDDIDSDHELKNEVKNKLFNVVAKLDGKREI